MTMQRRRGQVITLYPSVVQLDRRGNESLVPDMDNPIVERCSTSAERSNRAEAPGQIGVEVIQVRVRPGLVGVDLWARAMFKGRWWDIVAPPSEREGRAGVAHDTLLLRARPNSGVIEDG